METLFDHSTLSPLFGFALLDVIVINYRETTRLAHVLKVAGIVLENGGQEQEMIAAVLLQGVEDISVAVPAIRKKWGDAIADIVEDVVRSKGSFNSFSSALIASAKALDELRSLSNDPDQWSTENHCFYCELIERVKDYAPSNIVFELYFWVGAIWDDMN